MTVRWELWRKDPAILVGVLTASGSIPPWEWPAGEIPDDWPQNYQWRAKQLPEGSS